MKNILLLALVVSVIGIGCHTNFKPLVIEPLHIEPTPPYELDLSPIEQLKPESPPKPMYGVMDENGEITLVDDASLASHVILTPSEYAKFGVVVKMAGAYKEVTKEQEALINIYISQINTLKELAMIEREKSIAYREMWIESENAYRAERADRRLDKIITRTTMIGGTLATIAILGL